METYPVKLIPVEIQDALVSKPNDPIFNQKKPVLLDLYPKKGSYEELIPEIGLGFISSYAVSLLLNSLIDMPSSLIPLIVSTTTALVGFLGRKRQLNTYLRKKDVYEKRKAKYEEETIMYEKALEEYNNELERINSPDYLVEYRRNKTREVLKKTITYDETDSTHKSGFSELRFGGFLNSYFPGKIHVKLKVQNYTPDFTYIDKNLNLHIDVEIDEPYGYKNRELAHYIRPNVDEERDNYFLSQGWVVIKFSEKQALRSTEGCCKYIASVIAEITGDTKVLKDFAKIGNVNPDNRWTKHEAVVMEREDYRETYIDRTIDSYISAPFMEFEEP